MITAYAHNFDIQAWIFRFGNIVGPNPTHGVIYDFILRLREDPSILNILGDGSQAKPYVHVSDCLDGMHYGIKHATDLVNCFNLAVPDRTSVAQIAEWVLEAMELDRGACRLSYTGGSRGWRGDVPFVNLDTSRLRALGWAPSLGSDASVRRAIGEMAAQLCPERT